MESFDTWVPLLAGLLGALFGGAISIVVQWLSAQYQSKAQQQAWAEERSRWAAERRLDDFREIFDRTEVLMGAVVQFRIRKAHERRAAESGRDIPPHVVSPEEARSAFEEALSAIQRSILLLDEPFMEWSKKFSTFYFDWFVALSQDEGLEILQSFESSIEEFRLFVASEYKKAKADRARLSPEGD
ncbi:hypothetical protein [uncultured Hyphomonas sp.]|uniref:hypothetical protein n=1 Tax=uncultured Hyphomonas sp. TaxID=225298 RepID=UPI002AAAB17F|nr:hypothetical protein [uncultured Hyphomonas sp.]